MSENVVTSIIGASSAVIVGVVALVTNAKGFGFINKRIDGLETSINKRLELIETRLTVIESDIKQFNVEQGAQNTDIARLKDKAGIK